jgi:hypothetical protein
MSALHFIVDAGPANLMAKFLQRDIAVQGWSLHDEGAIDEASARTVMHASRSNAKDHYAGSLSRFTRWFVTPTAKASTS